MKNPRLRCAGASCSLLAIGGLAGCGWSNESEPEAVRSAAGASGDAGGQAGAAGLAGSAGAAGALVCEDVSPPEDTYTCEQQAEWGKCNESWMLGYCNLSCNRCGEVGAGGATDYGGPREVFAEYTDKQPLAPTPPMGWNSWNWFACNIDEETIMEIADAMDSSGMRDVGYEYVNIDDCWQAPEREDGNIVPDPVRFPSGMEALADYVHDRDLKLGIYSDRGTSTCAGYPGSYGYEIEDAKTYAKWGIDYLKYDNCAIPAGRENDPEMEEDYAIMGEALRQSGRDIVYSVCAWWFRPWMPNVGHLWRTTTDIKHVWSDNHHSVISLLNWSGGDTDRYGPWSEDDFESGAYAPPGLAQYAGPNAWNDPDMLEVGNGELPNAEPMNDDEYRAHFSLWALMAAPLIAGNDLRDMDDTTVEILTNPEVIAVNQDPLGVQGTPISESITLEVWAKELTGDDTHAVILFNRTEEEAEITVTWSSLGLSTSSALVRDLWEHADLGVVEDEYTASVPSHGVVMLKVTGE